MRDQVSEVKEKTDIVKLIGEHVALKKAGRHWKGLCPFHNEKTPSFIVSPEISMFKCFGCGESGDAFSFLEKYEGLTFAESLKVLAQRAGIELTHEKSQGDGIKDTLYEINDIASKYYHYILTNLSAGEPGRKYLKERGLTNKTIERYVVGFAPESKNALFTFLTQKKKYKPEVLLESGLVYKTDYGQFIDRFRGRIVFPIQNARGAVVALSGRILPGPLEKKLAKYINSPETQIYHKSDSLFGLFQAREEMKRKKYAIVVEGELDAILPSQNGYENIVAIKGSALTDGHIRILSRFVDTIYLSLDSDFAGNSASLKGIVLAQNAGLSVKVIDIGEYKDPDDFVRKDPTGFEKALRSAIGAWDFVLKILFSRYDISSPEGKSSVGRELSPYFSQMTDPILKAHYVHLVASSLGVPDEAMAQKVADQTEKKQFQVIFPKKEARVKKSRQDILEEKAMTLGILHDPSSLMQHRELFEKQIFRKIIDKLPENTKKLSIQKFAEELPPELKHEFLSLFLSEESENVEALSGILKELGKINIKEDIKKLSDEVQTLDREGKEAEILAKQKKIGELTKRLADYSI